MSFRLGGMFDIKSSEIPEMRKITASGRNRKRDHFRISERLTESVNIIAEIKHSSPSAGTLDCRMEYREIVNRYVNAGVSGISVLAEKQFFGGSYYLLDSVSAICEVPVLCKDFIYFVDQIEAAYNCGADMVLLISRILERNRLKDLFDVIRAFGMEPVVEIHEVAEIDSISFLDPEIVLVNMRNLDTLAIDFPAGIETLNNLPESVTRISASGINSGDDIAYVMNSTGVNSFLVGTSLMTHNEPDRLIMEFKNVR